MWKSSCQDQVFTTTSSSQSLAGSSHFRTRSLLQNLHFRTRSLLQHLRLRIRSLLRIFTSKPGLSFARTRSKFFSSDLGLGWKSFSQVQMFTTKYSFQTLKSSFQSQVLIFISEPELWKSFSQAQIFTTKSSFQSLGSGTPHVRTRSLLPKSCVRALALEVLFQTRSYCNIFISEPGLWKSFPRTRSLLQNLHVRAWTLEVLFQTRSLLQYLQFRAWPSHYVRSTAVVALA